MTHVLFIDDEPLNHQLIARALAPLGAQLSFAEDGMSGIARARALKPDIIITDVMMPGMDGYDVTRQLRRDPQFSSVPVLVLTVQSSLQDKLKAFEAGADDYMSKPFELAELTARVTALLRRVEINASYAALNVVADPAYMIALHSLRGGTGCSTLAVNLAISLSSLWGQTILLDLAMTAGQIALMLNMNLRRTWTNISGLRAAEIDLEILNSVISTHESGISFIAAPTFPTEGEPLQSEMLSSVLTLLKRHYSYLVADVPHDFSENAITALDAADTILIVANSDMASVRAAAAALDTYGKLGYPEGKLKLLLNATFPRAGLQKEKIEKALGLQFIASIPYVPDLFVEAINYGQPPVFEKPTDPASAFLEDLAFFLSKPADKKAKPENPTEAWKRVYKRSQERRK